MNYYIGADLGTSALKLLLTDKNGKIINSISKKYPLKRKKTVYPSEEKVRLYEKKYQKFKKIYPAIKELYKELKEE